jgi:hypothetical protein
VSDTPNYNIIITAILYRGIVAKCSKVLKVARCEYQSQYRLQMDKEIRGIDGKLSREN